jgi:dTDP-glucose 4,6-dehydratase
MSRRMLVTGGLGFIGSEFIRRTVASGEHILNVDAYTYAADEQRIATLPAEAFSTEALDVADERLRRLLVDERPRVVVHFAAESHVTRSEQAEDAFFRANVDGTRNVLESAEAAGAELLVHVSTDEVYGPCYGDPFPEEAKLPGEGRATSSYARSKAIADDLALSYAGRVPVIVVRPTNCYGPWQHPEKAIPRWITRALRDQPIPVWGDGRQVRDWMYVGDAVDAILTVIAKGSPGEVYNIGPGGPQLSNLEVAVMVAAAAGRDPQDVYLTAYDRPNHDRRYAVDTSKIADLGWGATSDFAARVQETVDWYRRNDAWWRPKLQDSEGLYDDSATSRTTRGMSSKSQG